MTEIQFTTNAISAKAERRTGPDGRAYLVAPGVPIVAGVLGNQYVPVEEIAKTAQAWAGRALPLSHPMQDGHHISVNSPEVIHESSVGYFWNAQMDGDKLRGEYWIDEEKAQAMGGDALIMLAALNANQRIETSTGYWRDSVEESGEFNGKPYQSIARNIVPDHIAILVNEIGNCSIADGCGLLANSSGCGCDECLTANAHTGAMVAFYLTDDAAQQLAAYQSNFPDGSDLTPVNEMHVTLGYLGQVDEIVRSEADILRALTDFTKWQPVIRARVGGVGRFNKVTDGKQAVFAQVDSESLMHFQRELVDVLRFGDIYPSREHGFTPHITLAYVPEDDATEFPSLPEVELIFDSISLSWGDNVTRFSLQGEAVPMASNSNEESMSKKQDEAVTDVAEDAADVTPQEDVTEVEVTVEVEADDATPVTNSADTIMVNASEWAKMQGLAEFVNGFGGADKLRQTLDTANQYVQTMAANAKREKDSLITALVANARCKFSQEQLETLDVEMLSTMADSLAVNADYSGRGFPTVNTATDNSDWEAYEAPEVE